MAISTTLLAIYPISLVFRESATSLMFSLLASVAIGVMNHLETKIPENKNKTNKT